MGKTFRKWTCYPLWEAHNEERDLNNASKNGYQLVKGGAFSWILEKNDSVRYTYQIDFNPGAKLDPRYKETFAEMGWEYVSSTFNGWHYFKKPYQEGQQLENGDVVQSERIYTDEESFNELAHRWQKLGKGLSGFAFAMWLFYIILAIISGITEFSFMAIGFFFFGISTSSSIKNYKSKAKNPNYVPKIQISFRIAIQFFIVFALLTLLLIFL